MLFRSEEAALDRTTEQSLKSAGISYNIGDVMFKKTREKISDDVDKGVLALTVNNENKPVYKRKLGFWQSIYDTAIESVENDKEALDFQNADTKTRIKLAEEFNKKESASVKNYVGEMFGGAALPITEATVGAMSGTAIFPGVGTAAGVFGAILGMSQTAYNVGYRNSTIERYNQDVNEIIRKKGTITEKEKEDAMERASTQGVIGGLGDVTFAAGLATIPVGNYFAGRGFLKIGRAHV